MKTALDSFTGRLSELEAEIRLQAAVSDIRKLGRAGALADSHIAEQTLSDLLAPSSASRRRAQYCGAVVELYATWEAFIELIVRAYAEDCASSGTSLAEDVCKKHLPKTMEVIALVQKGVPRYAGQDLGALLENATSVQRGDYSRINSIALAHHSANMRSVTVQSLLGDMGAEQGWSQALRDSGFLATLRDAGLPVPRDNGLSFLDELCSRRNDIAHGNLVQDTFDETFQLAYLKGVRSLGRALHDALFAHSFHPDSNAYELVGSYEERYKGSIVVIIAVAGAFLTEGDICVLQSPGGGRIARTVTSIQVDSVSQSSAMVVSDGMELGVQFSDKVGSRADVFVRRKPA